MYCTRTAAVLCVFRRTYKVSLSLASFDTPLLWPSKRLGLILYMFKVWLCWYGGLTEAMHNIIHYFLSNCFCHHQCCHRVRPALNPRLFVSAGIQKQTYFDVFVYWPLALLLLINNVEHIASVFLSYYWWVFARAKEKKCLSRRMYFNIKSMHASHDHWLVRASAAQH